MAKYDQGGGCACGLFKECKCAYQTAETRVAETRARFKITDEMVSAAVMAYFRAAEDEGYPPPTETDNPEQWEQMRAVTKKALQAAADVAWYGRVDKTKSEIAAWLDGYKAAAETAASFQVRVDSGAVDEALNSGASLVAALLQSQVSLFEKGKKHG